MSKKALLAVGLMIFAAVAMVVAQEEDTTKIEQKVVPEPQKEVAAEAVEEKVAAPQMAIEAEICAGIEERMPTGMADTFTPDVEKVYLWCKVIGCKDTTMVHHVWYYNGKEMADVELPVRSSSWRTWSSKTILPSWTGDWEVKILDAAGNELKSAQFKVAAATTQ